MHVFKPAALIAAGAYALIAGGIAPGELHTRIFGPGNSEMAGLATYAIALPSSYLADRALEAAGMPIGRSDAGFVLFCAASVLSNSVLVYSSVWSAVRVIDREGTR